MVKKTFKTNKNGKTKKRRKTSFTMYPLNLNFDKKTNKTAEIPPAGMQFEILYFSNRLL